MNGVKVAINQDGLSIVVHVENGVVLGHDLKEGEKIVELGKFNDFIKPKWNGMEWFEGATEEEIIKWETDRIMEYQVTEEQRRITDLEMAIAEMMGGVF